MKLIKGFIILFLAFQVKLLQAKGNIKSHTTSTINCQHTESTFRCVRYIRNYDGDTITFHIPNVHEILKTVSIRVRGIDTPEINSRDECEKEMARRAKERVKAIMARAKRIELRNIEPGKYFRIVANVIVNGRYLSRKLIKEDYAVPYDGGTKIPVDWCNYLD